MKMPNVKAPNVKKLSTDRDITIIKSLNEKVTVVIYCHFLIRRLGKGEDVLSFALAKRGNW